MSAAPSRYASPRCVLGRRKPSTYAAYASGFRLPRALRCSHLDAARVGVKSESDRNVQRLGE